MSDKTNREKAYEQMASRLGDMREYLDVANDGRDVTDPDDTSEELGPLDEYGLEWTKDVTNHRDQTVTYVHVLSTGGPHEEFQITFDPEKGTVDDVLFVSKPWFGREEIRLVGSDDETAVSFYEAFFSEYVVMEWESGEGR